MGISSKVLLAHLGLCEPVHLMGAGGAGMSALGELLLDCGVSVTGCDRSPSARLEDLRARGMVLWVGHDDGGHSQGGSIIHTAAISREHPELLRARARSLKVIPRSVVLGRLTRAIPSVCVAGSHGKSTVTAMLAHILAGAGRNPGYLVGGVLRHDNRGGYLGDGTMLVLETDEFDRAIERVSPHLAVITNVEPEHLDVYGSFRGLRAAFDRFASRSSLQPLTWVDGPGGFIPRLSARSIRCGMLPHGDVRGEVAARAGLSHTLLVHMTDRSPVDALLAVPGIHNAANGTLAAAAAWQLGVPSEAIARGLASYPGLQRRFETLAASGESSIVTDYAHHPTEIRATLATAALRGVPVVAVFQPHLYSRTALLFDDFARSFSAAHRVMVTPIYAAREVPLAGASAEELADAIRTQGTDAEFVSNIDSLEGKLTPAIQSPVVVVFMSAGDLDGFARRFATDLVRRRAWGKGP